MYEYIYTYNKNWWKYSWKFEGGEVYMEDFGEMEKEDRNKKKYNFKNKQKISHKETKIFPPKNWISTEKLSVWTYGDSCEWNMISVQLKKTKFHNEKFLLLRVVWSVRDYF